MSTAVASFAPAVERHISPPKFTAIASATSAASHTSEREPAPKRIRSHGSPGDIHGAVDRPTSTDKTSPTSVPAPALPVIKVKKEPGSPSMSSRPRPKRLDLSSTTSNSRGPQTAGQASSRPSAPLTSRESAGLAIQDVGLACLSPGFQTNDPSMREQLQRSLDVRDQQRQIIEARQKGGKPGSSSHDNDPASRTQDTTLFGAQVRTPTTSRRKGPPPGLSIAAPSASQFAHDRVIQSAPLNQTFTGLRPGDQAYSRHIQHGPSALSQTSHIHHVPAVQTNNRLPPIADVFANDRFEGQKSFPSAPSPPHAAPPSVPSPGFPPQHGGPALSSRGREFRSAEEAVAGLSGGRDELMPKVVHYGGVQPPTPPSPMPPGGYNNTYPPLHHSQSHMTTAGAQQQQQHQQPHPPSSHSEGGGGGATYSDPRPDILSRTSSMNGRRRGREEYERDNGSPPAPRFPRPAEIKRATLAVRGEDVRDNNAAAAAAEAAFEEREREDWRSGMSGAEKKEEFLRLCERAWDLFHS